MEEYGGIAGQPLGRKVRGLRVCLQGAALASGQKICQPVEDGAQRLTGCRVLTPVGPAGTGPYKTLHGNNGTGAGVLGDAALMIGSCKGAQLRQDALGACQIQPVFPAVSAEIGLVDQAVGTGRKAAYQLPSALWHSCQPLRNSWKFRQRRPMVE